jgi:hypothetical protein
LHGHFAPQTSDGENIKRAIILLAFISKLNLV